MNLNGGIYFMDTINYDFSSIIQIFNKIKNSNASIPVNANDLGVLKTELNRFFRDSSCKEILYTTNTDNMFFGIKIIPMINCSDIYEILTNEDSYRIDKYLVELDSKLFDPILNLNAKEITSLLLYEVNKIVGDSTPIDNARNALNIYIASNKDKLRISDSIHYKEILAFGLKDYLSKSTSIFYTTDPFDIYNDTFTVSYGLNNAIVSVYEKITSNNIKLYENSEISKFITFSWILSIYRNLKIHRVGAIKQLTAMLPLTGSRLEKLEIKNILTRIKRIDDTDLITESANNNLKARIRERMKKNRIHNLRAVTSTFYELAMRIKNVEDEGEALSIMRTINNNIGIINDYLDSDTCDEREKVEWQDALGKFLKLREKLSDTVVYRNTSYGVFVNYPNIVENRYN